MEDLEGVVQLYNRLLIDLCQQVPFCLDMVHL